MKKFKYCLTPVTRKTKLYVDKECEKGNYNELLELAASSYKDGVNAGSVVGLVTSGIACLGAGLFFMGYDHFKNKHDDKKLREKEENEA